MTVRGLRGDADAWAAAVPPVVRYALRTRLETAMVRGSQQADACRSPTINHQLSTINRQAVSGAECESCRSREGPHWAFQRSQWSAMVIATMASAIGMNLGSRQGSC